MTFELTRTETRRLEDSIATALRAYQADRVGEAQMIKLVTQLVESAALGNHAVLIDWLYSERIKQWLEDCQGELN